MIYRIRLGTFTKRQQILKKQRKHWTNSTEKHKYASSIRKYWVNISVIAYFIQKFFRNCIFIENKCIKALQKVKSSGISAFPGWSFVNPLPSICCLLHSWYRASTFAG